MADTGKTTGADGDHARWPRNKIDAEFAAMRMENSRLKMILATLVKRTGWYKQYSSAATRKRQTHTQNIFLHLGKTYLLPLLAKAKESISQRRKIYCMMLQVHHSPSIFCSEAVILRRQNLSCTSARTDYGMMILSQLLLLMV